MKRINLTLDEESIKVLDELKWQTRMSKSELIRKVICYFGKNVKQLKKILFGEQKIDRKI